MALGFASSPRSWTSWTTRANSTTTCGASTVPSSGPVGLPAGGGKGSIRQAEDLQTQVQEPLDQEHFCEVVLDRSTW